MRKGPTFEQCVDIFVWSVGRYCKCEFLLLRQLKIVFVRNVVAISDVFALIWQQKKKKNQLYRMTFLLLVFSFGVFSMFFFLHIFLFIMFRFSHRFSHLNALLNYWHYPKNTLNVDGIISI